jgi:MFS family permease
MKPCSQCGEPASVWTHDPLLGLCRKCRKANAAAHPLSLSHLTFSGWLLTFVTIGVLVGLMIPYGGWLSDHLPGGHYPAEILALPIIALALAFFAMGAFVLKRSGLPVWKSSYECFASVESGRTLRLG